MNNNKTAVMGERTVARIKQETVREWKDRMEVEHRDIYNSMVSKLGRIESNCLFAIANADKEISEFAQIILSIVKAERGQE